MTYLIIDIPDNDVISVTLEPDTAISINYSVAYELDSAVPSESVTRQEFTFVDADLNSQNRITFTHNLGAQDFVDYALFSPYFEDRVTPDKTIYAVNQLTLDLTSFRPLVGLWRIMIERN
jgi:hypothetical protein